MEKYKMQAKRLTVSGNMGNTKPETVDRGVFFRQKNKIQVLKQFEGPR
jgi:hypothetical protein